MIYLDLIRAPYVLYGVKYIDPVSLAPFSGCSRIVNIKKKMAQHLDLRCGLLSDPSTHTPKAVTYHEQSRCCSTGLCRGSQPKHVSNPASIIARVAFSAERTRPYYCTHGPASNADAGWHELTRADSSAERFALSPKHTITMAYATGHTGRCYTKPWPYATGHTGR